MMVTIYVEYGDFVQAVKLLRQTTLIVMSKVNFNPYIAEAEQSTKNQILDKLVFCKQ